MNIGMNRFFSAQLCLKYFTRLSDSIQGVGTSLYKNLRLVTNSSDQMSTAAKERKAWLLDPDKRSAAFKAALKDVQNGGIHVVQDVPKCLSASNDKFY